MDMNAVPKTINYCWFGKGQLPRSVKKCIKSWEKYCPNYKIVRWDESNYDIESKCSFVKKAYEHGKWAFVSDYARLDIIYHHGGVYLDTDVELIASLDTLLSLGNGFWGFEKENLINSGLGFACKKEEPVLKEMLEVYEGMNFNEKDMSSITCPFINTSVLQMHGLTADNTFQYVNGMAILPTEFLCPENMYTGKKEYTERTVSIHHYNASWQTQKQQWKNKLIIKVKQMLPDILVEKIRCKVRESRNIHDEN